MIANMGYAAAMLQTGAAFLQITAPMTADRRAFEQPPSVGADALVWSDRRYEFSFALPSATFVKLDEKQSRTLHNALIASFDEFVPPIMIS